MTLQQLQYFKVAADKRAYNRAAEILYISQPAITQQVQKLEHQLGTKLFIRDQAGLELTSAGHTLYQYAVRILGDINEIPDAIQREATGRHAVLNVGTVRSVAYYALSGILAKLTARHPDIFIRIHEGDGHSIREMVLQGALHVGIVTDYDSDRDGHHVRLVRQPLMTDYVVAIASIPFPHAMVTLGEVCQYPLVLFSERFALRRQLEYLAARQGLVLDAILECNDFLTIMGMVQAGIGVSILPRSNVVTRPDLFQGLYWVPLDPLLEQTTCLIATQSFATRPVVQVFTRITQEQFCHTRK